MLKSVRCVGFGSLMRNVHWLYALAAATSMVSCGPRRSSDAKSTAYETDIVEPDRASGSVTLRTDVTEESTIRTRSGTGSLNTINGTDTTSSTAPIAMTRQTNNRAARGHDPMR